MKLLKETQSPLLSRRRVEVLIDHNKAVTPTKAAVLKSLSDHFKTAEDTIFIQHIYTQYGEGASKVIANIYKDKASLEIVEIKKKQPKKDKAKAAPAKK